MERRFEHLVRGSLREGEKFFSRSGEKLEIKERGRQTKSIIKKWQGLVVRKRP